MTTALFLLRCKQLGLSFPELEEISMGMVNDMHIESHNDDFKYQEVASQEDFNKF